MREWEKWEKLLVWKWVWEREFERMSEINYEWKIEYKREFVREILSESMCVRMRGGESVVCLCVCEMDRELEKLCKCVWKTEIMREWVREKYERMSDSMCERNCECASEYEHERENGCVWTRGSVWLREYEREC